MPRDNLIQLRGGTAAAWATANPVLGAREPGYETDTGRLKVGDGASAWDVLEYAVGAGLTTGAALAAKVINLNPHISIVYPDVLYAPTLGTTLEGVELLPAFQPVQLALKVPPGIYKAQARFTTGVIAYSNMFPSLRLSVEPDQTPGGMSTQETLTPEVGSVAGQPLSLEFNNALITVAEGDAVVFEGYGEMYSIGDGVSVDAFLKLTPLALV